MKKRILDYVNETPRSAHEIYEIMCADGFTYGGATPQYTTQHSLGNWWREGVISRELKEGGLSGGRGDPRQYYYSTTITDHGFAG